MNQAPPLSADDAAAGSLRGADLSAALPRIVVLDDDPAMQVYTQSALEHLAVDLVMSDTVEQAWQALLAGPADLLLTDLMLGGESGLTLIERLRSGALHLRSIKVVVASAASDAAGVAERLRELQVWRVLRKPVGLQALEACVVEACAGRLPAGRKDATLSAAAAGAQGPAADRAAAVAEVFDGDWVLYDRYHASCVKQMPVDVAQGDAAFACDDAPTIRRLGHNLQSMLRTLGNVEAAAQAAELEAAILAGDAGAAARVWGNLRAALQAFGAG